MPSPYRRFVAVLADANARLGADVDRYSFIVVDLHHLLLAGLPAHFESHMPSQAVGLWPLPSGGSAWCPSARISIPQVITMFYDAACEVHHEHFSRIADRWVRRPKSDLELLDRSCLDDSVSAWVGNRLKTR